ncbi:MAG: transporter [Burkholderiales bacterium]|nr:transporter [Burkholderiales bacterium]
MAQDAQRGLVRLGYDSSTGKYGTDLRATTQTTRLAGSWYVGDWTFDASLPYLRRDVESVVGARGTRFGPRAALIVASGRVPPGSRTTRTITEGIGDVTTSASRYFYGADAESLVWEAGVSVKWNTGDADRNLGSGARDVTFLGGAFKRTGRLNLGSSITYTLVGETSGTPVKDVWGLSFDASYRLGEAWRVGSSFAWEQAAVAGTQAPRSLSVFVARDLSASMRLQFSAMRGGSTSSPNWGGGASLTLRF